MPDMRSTLHESSACDSVPAGGASISYDLDSNFSLKVVLERFYSAGWSDLPASAQPCLRDDCIAGVGKRVDGRHIEVTVQKSSNGAYMLEALFGD
jgi:hypothetical protein